MAPKSHPLVPTIWGILFLIVGVGISFVCLDQIRLAKVSKDWPQVDGRILRSEVEGSRGSRQPNVIYEYYVDGKRFTSNLISFDIWDLRGGKGVLESILIRYSVGDKVVVYHDPKNPELAILEPEVYDPFYIPIIVGGFILLAGTWMSFWGIRALLTGASSDQSVSISKQE